MKTKTLLTCLLALASLMGAAQSSAADSFQVSVSGQGRPMILIPGLACNGQVWDEVVEHYDSSYECHVLTLAGFGGLSPIQHDGAFLNTVKNELTAYLAENQIERPIVVGHSLGGFLALWIAAEHPDALGPLVIVDSLPFLPVVYNPYATVESMQAMAAQQRDQMLNASSAPSDAQTTAMLQSMITAPDRIQKALIMSQRSDGATVAQAMYELNTTDLRHNIASIQSPTLVLGAWIAYRDYGATRESTEAIFRSQYRELPNFQVAMTDHGRHFIMWDDPEFFFDQVDSFLEASLASH